MNMTNSRKFVRRLLSKTHEIISIEFRSEERTSTQYIAVIRPKGSVTYRRVGLLVCGPKSTALTEWRNLYGIPSMGGKVERQVNYGLGSWCCSFRLPTGAVNTVLVVSTKLQNRELNQGTY